MFSEHLDDSYRWIVLLVTSLSAFMTPFDSSVVNIALPSISTALSLDITSTTWIQTSYLLAMCAPLVSAGRLGDLKGRKPLFIFGTLAFTAGSASSAYSGSGTLLLLSRVVQGFGASFISANATAILVETFPGKDRGKALGVNTMVVYAGLTAGPLLGGLLVQSFGWRSIFLMNIPLGITVTLLSSKWLRAGRKSLEEPFDLLGAALFAISLASSLAALSLARSSASGPLPVILLTVTGAVTFGVFLLAESRLMTHPMLDLSLFARNRLFSAANATALAYYVSSNSTSFLVSYYLQSVLGLSPGEAGLTLLIMPLAMALISPLSGWVSDRQGSRVMSSIGMATVAVSFVILSLLKVGGPPQEALIGLLLCGIGSGIFSAPNSSAVMGSLPREKLGVASGTLGTMRFTGQALSMTIAGALLTGSTASANLFVQAMSGAFIVSTVVAGIGFLASISRGSEG